MQKLIFSLAILLIIITVSPTESQAQFLSGSSYTKPRKKLKKRKTCKRLHKSYRKNGVSGLVTSRRKSSRSNGRKVTKRRRRG